MVWSYYGDKERKGETVLGEVNPSVSVTCITYKRTKYLTGLVEMFLAQDYLGKKEFVLLNDDPSVEIICNHDEITVYNWDKRFKNIRKKYQTSYDLSVNEVIIPWDDDDLFEPWTISTHIKALGSHDFCAPVGFYKGTKGNRLNHSHGAMYSIRREALDRIGGIPLLDEKALKAGLIRNASHTAFAKKLKELGMYREHPLNKNELFFTWRSAHADHSQWRENPTMHPEKYLPFDGTPERFEIKWEE